MRVVARPLPEKPLSLYPVICPDANIGRLQAPTASYGAPNTVIDCVPSTEGQSQPLLWVLPSRHLEKRATWTRRCTFSF